MGFGGEMVIFNSAVHLSYFTDEEVALETCALSKVTIQHNGAIFKELLH